MALSAAIFPNADWDGNAQDTTGDGSADTTLAQAGDYNEHSSEILEVQRLLRGKVATAHGGAVIACVNKTGGVLTCGKMAVFAGFDATTGLPSIAYAAANAAGYRDLAGLIVMEKGGDVDEVADDGIAYVLRDGASYALVDTSSFSAGDFLWLAASGALSATRVTGYPPVAQVDVDHATLGVLTVFAAGAHVHTALPRATSMVRIGGISGSDDRYLFVAPAASYIRQVSLVSDTATSSSDGTDNYTFQVANLTQTNNLLASAKSTNGAEIAADTVYDLDPDQNQQVAANDVLELQITKNNAPTDLSSAEISAVIEYDLVRDS